MAMGMEDRMTRVEDRMALRNLMHTYSYLNEYDRDQVFKDMWSKRPDIALEYENYGVFDGPGSIRRFYAAMPAAKNALPNMRTLYNDYIEIADDGATAQGAWLSIGFATPVNGGAPEAQWVHCRYGVDFVKEGGDWKFLRMHVYTGFVAPYDKSWVDVSYERGGLNAGGLPPGVSNPLTPDRANTQDIPYSLRVVPPVIPRLPEPQKTFVEVTSYVPRPAPK